MRKIIIFLIILISVAPLFSQSSIKFDSLVYDFGKIKEEDGPYEHTFHFTNVSSKPLKLTKVKAGCGCTVASWSTGLIPPKGKGFIKVVFDSNNHPGEFKKKVLVYYGEGQKPITLTVKGFVIGTPGKFYPKNTIGNLQFDVSYLQCNRISEKERKEKIVNIYNKGGKPLKVEIVEKPEFIDVKLSKNLLKPKEKAKMVIVCNSDKIKRFGQIREPIKFSLNGKVQRKVFYIKLYRYFDFSKLTFEEKNNAPHVKILNKETSFKYYKQNKEKYDKIKIINYGKSTLKIFNIETSNKIKTVSYPKELKPQEIGEIVIEIKNKNKISNFRGYIKIYSNDPLHFETILTIYGQTKQTVPKKEENKFKYISTREFWKFKDKLAEAPYSIEIMKNNKINKIIILDVRNKNSFNKHHIKGSLNIPLETGELEESLDKLDKKSTIYYIVGNDFEQADVSAKMMTKAGFSHVICVKGSYLEFLGMK